MKEITIDCREIASRADFHRTFAAAMSFPEWYGNNLDALYDQLTSVGVDTTVILRNWAEAEGALGRYAICARRAMEDAVKENPKLKIVLE